MECSVTPYIGLTKEQEHMLGTPNYANPFQETRLDCGINFWRQKSMDHDALRRDVASFHALSLSLKALS